jgi:hemolysin III
MVVNKSQINMTRTEQMKATSSQQMIKNGRDRVQSLAEEIANAVTHGVGAGLAIAGLAIAVVVAVQRGDTYSVVGASIFGATLVLLYLASTLFHAFQRENVKVAVRRFFHILDHIGIAFLIAGTYTPFALKLRGSGGWTILVIIWSLAIAVSCIKAFFTGRFNGVTALAYVVMGWLGVFMIGDLMTNFGVGPIIWLTVGGVAYTVGVIPFLWEKLPFNHAIWHLFVMAGSICHFLGILFYILPTTV